MVVGGAEKVLIDLVNNLNSSEFDITVIALFRKSVYSDYEFQFENSFGAHIRYKYLIDNSSRIKYLFFNYLYNKLNKKWIYRQLIKEKFDTEVAFYEGFPTIFVASSTQKSKKIAWLHIEQNSIYKDCLQREIGLKHDLYKKYDAIISVSEAVAQSFRCIFSDLTAHTCYNPIDGRKVIEMAKAQVQEANVHSTTNFISVGRLTYQKAYGRLIEVCGVLLKEGFNFNLQIIGDGHMMDELLEKIKTNQVERNVQLLGFRANPYPYIKAADYFISSSFYEGLSTVVIEAQILGVPTIVTNCTGMVEIVEDGVNGIICENSDSGLLEALRTVLTQNKNVSQRQNLIGNLPTNIGFEKAIKCIETYLNHSAI